MTVAWVRELASKITGAVASTTEVITLSASATAGNTVALCLTTVTGASGDTASVSDSRGNTWTVDSSNVSVSQNRVLIATTRQDVGTLQSGDTVTVTFSANTASSMRIAWIEEFSGVVTSSYVDASNTQSITSNLVGSGASATPHQNGDLALSVVQSNSGTLTISLNGTGTVGTYSAFTTGMQQGTSGFSRSAHCCYQALSTSSGFNTSQAHVYSLSTSNGSVVAFLLLRGNSVSVSSSDTASGTEANSTGRTFSVSDTEGLSTPIQNDGSINLTHRERDLSSDEGLDDEFFRTITLPVIDTVDLSPTTERTFVLTFSDTETLSDSFTRPAAYVTNVTDVVDFYAFNSRVNGPIIFFTDNEELNDEVDVPREVSATYSDVVSISDAVEITNEHGRLFQYIEYHVDVVEP